MSLPVLVVAVEQYCCKLFPFPAGSGYPLQCLSRKAVSGTKAFALYPHRAFCYYPGINSATTIFVL